MKQLLALISAFLAVPVLAADAQPAPATSPAAAPAPAAKSNASVARAQFTSAIQDREPTDTLTSLANDKTRIFYFTEIRDGAGQKITHRWEYNGKVMSEMSFDVGSSRWRVFSSKNLDPSWTGEWKVSVVDESGGTLGASTFTYEAPKAAAPATAPAAPATPAAR